MKYKLYIAAIALLCTCSLNLKAQIIITIAGNDTAGYSGDGDQAINASFNWPSAIAVDHSGDMYIVDMDNNIIRKVDPSGFITAFAGNTLIGYVGDGFNAAVAKFNNPTDVALDQFGNVYIADQYNHVIRKINASRIISTFAGNGFEASTGAGGYSGDGGPAVEAEFYSPQSIAFDVPGNLYISDIGNSVIRKVTPAGLISTIAGISMQTGYSGDGGDATAAKLNSPMGLAVDNAGNLFIADQFNNVVRKVNTAGVISTVAGNGYHNGSADHSGGYTGDGGPATSAELSLPADVAIDGSGNLFIADEYNHVIREVSTSGSISTVAGSGSPGYSGDWGWAKSAKLNFPSGIAFNGSGDLLIADLNNNVIRKVNTGTTGINQPTAAKNELRLILNPNKGVFFVKGTMGQMTDQNVSLEVLDMEGQVVYKNTLTARDGAIDTQVTLDNNLANGMYILRVSTASETNISRFVIEK